TQIDRSILLKSLLFLRSFSLKAEAYSNELILSVKHFLKLIFRSFFALLPAAFAFPLCPDNGGAL
ncbi:TPA: hypothetical protein ACN373_004910, partial [Vibrio parahaemolyticus]